MDFCVIGALINPWYTSANRCLASQANLLSKWQISDYSFLSLAEGSNCICVIWIKVG